MADGDEDDDEEDFVEDMELEVDEDAKPCTLVEMMLHSKAVRAALCQEVPMVTNKGRQLQFVVIIIHK